jgi:nicotinamide-nucleotide amidase
LLLRRNMTLSVAESCTGGLCSKRLTDVPGSSKYIKLNVVTYANEMKVKLLGVSPEILDKHGAVSAECAEAMAEGMRKLSGADLSLSITGVAGPDGGTAEKPVGLVYIALASGSDCKHKVLNLPVTFSRAEIRQRTVSEALNMVRLSLLP